MPEQETAGETHQHAHATAQAQGAWFFDWLREGADKLSQTLAPPEDAAKHFREARLEVLRGVRELIDHRIEVLSRAKPKGSRIVVE